jgi:Family of unknown function (DUF6717)
MSVSPLVSTFFFGLEQGILQCRMKMKTETVAPKRRTNSIGVIFPYKRNGVWAFDDPSVGLVHEPFVLGIPEIIEAFVKDIPDAETGFALFFSTTPFPRYQTKLVWVREDANGNWYREELTGLQGWLCPALYHYFQQAPRTLYCEAGAKSQHTLADSTVVFASPCRWCRVAIQDRTAMEAHERTCEKHPSNEVTPEDLAAWAWTPDGN